MTQVLRDKDMVLNALRWPVWPVLPLTHRHKPFLTEGHLGLLVDKDGPPYKVYLGNMVDLCLANQPMEQTLRDWKVEQYDTIDELLNDWRVD